MVQRRDPRRMARVGRVNCTRSAQRLIRTWQGKRAGEDSLAPSRARPKHRESGRQPSSARGWVPRPQDPLTPWLSNPCLTLTERPRPFSEAFLEQAARGIRRLYQDVILTTPTVIVEPTPRCSVGSSCCIFVFCNL
jgi:hypothetical protein